MSFTLIAHQIQDGSGGNGVDTTALDSTGAKLIILYSNAFATSTATPTDTASNTWVPLTDHGNANAHNRFWYCINPTTSATHKFHPFPNGGFPSIGVLVFSSTGTVVFDQENGSGSTSPGSLTPPSAALFVTGCTADSASGISIDSSFIFVDSIPGSGGNSLALGTAYKSSSSVESPAWTGFASEVTSVIATFTDGGGGGGLTVTANDTLSLSDSLFITYTLLLLEGFTLSDFLQFGLSLPVVITGETITLSDAVQFLIGIGFSKSDSLSFSDVLKIATAVARIMGDNILLSDFLATLLTDKPVYSDTLGFSDTARLILSLGISSSDSLSLSDVVQIVIANNLQLTQTDSLSLSDSVVYNLSSQMDSYIRHYLNDVPR